MKPRIYGSQRAYIPNAKADMRRKKGYLRGQEIAERAEEKSRERMRRGKPNETG